MGIIRKEKKQMYCSCGYKLSKHTGYFRWYEGWHYCEQCKKFTFRLKEELEEMKRTFF